LLSASLIKPALRAAPGHHSHERGATPVSRAHARIAAAIRSPFHVP
jgi:hypothetical protein